MYRGILAALTSARSRGRQSMAAGSSSEASLPELLSLLTGKEFDTVRPNPWQCMEEAIPVTLYII